MTLRIAPVPSGQLTTPAPAEPDLAALMWAEQHGSEADRNRAAHIRELLATLADSRARESRKAEIRAEIRSLGMELVSVRARLRRLGGPGMATAVIRTWAKQQGLAVAPGGPLPPEIINAFELRLGPQAPLHRKTITIARLQTQMASVQLRRMTAQRRLDRDHADIPPASVIRAWARNQGLDVPADGRLPQRIVDAYTAHFEIGDAVALRTTVTATGQRNLWNPDVSPRARVTAARPATRSPRRPVEVTHR